jgi:hypothetical protein
MSLERFHLMLNMNYTSLLANIKIRFGQGLAIKEIIEENAVIL